jgi:hypothetical protein
VDGHHFLHSGRRPLGIKANHGRKVKKDKIIKKIADTLANNHSPAQTIPIPYKTYMIL